MLVLSNPVESLASAMIIMMMAITMMIVIMIINHHWRFDTVLIVQTYVRGSELHAAVQQPGRGSDPSHDDDEDCHD